MNNTNYERGEATRNKILDIIQEYIDEHGYSPTVREIQEAAGIKSTSTIHAQLRVLQESGRITREKGSSRTLKVVEEFAMGKNDKLREKQVNALAQYIFNNLHWCPFKDEDKIDFEKECVGFGEKGCKECILKNAEQLN